MRSVKSKGQRAAGDALRARAERKLRGKKKVQRTSQPATFDARRLVHELQVHQIELELQNFELQEARVALERGLSQYSELFDFAPIGYASLADSSAIRQVNLVGAQTLGGERAQLIGLPFRSFVAAEQRAYFDNMIGRARESGERERCEIEAVVRPAGYKVLR